MAPARACIARTAGRGAGWTALKRRPHAPPVHAARRLTAPDRARPPPPFQILGLSAAFALSAVLTAAPAKADLVGVGAYVLWARRRADRRKGRPDAPTGSGWRGARTRRRFVDPTQNR